MNQKQINRQEMYQDSNSYLDTHTSIWSSIPIAATYKTQLATVIDQIKSIAMQQDAAQVFISKSLRQVKHDVAQKMDILDDILEAFAADSDNPELLARTSNAASSYYRLTHEEFEIKTKNVLTLLESHTDSLVDYGFSTAQLDDAKQTFNTFSDLRGKPRAYKVASRVATMGLEDLFTEGDKCISRMDNIFKRFKRSNPAFFNGYEAVRHIVKN